MINDKSHCADLPGGCRPDNRLRKNRRGEWVAAGLLACALLLGGCSKEPFDDPVVNGDKVEVSFDIDGFDQWDAPSQAAASNSGPMAGKDAAASAGVPATRAAVNLATNTTVRVIAYKSGTNPATANYITDQAYYWDGSKLVPCTVDDNGENPRAYPKRVMQLISETAYDLYAVSPALPLKDDKITLKTSVVNGVDYATSIKTITVPADGGTITLEPLARKCAQVTFIVQKDATYIDPLTLTVNSVSVSGLPNAQSSVKPGADLTAATSGTQTLTLQSTDFTGNGMIYTSKQSYLYLPMSGAKLTFSYNLQVNGAQKTIAGELRNFTLEKGKKYTIVANVSAESTVTLLVNPWTEFDNNAGLGNNSDYPYVVDGKYIVVLDRYGYADPATYPIHGKWTDQWQSAHYYCASTPSHTETSWDSNNSGSNTVAVKFEIASTGSNEDLKVDKILDFCQTYDTPTGSVGQWRIPTIRELKLIYDKKNELTVVESFSGPYWSATTSPIMSNRKWSVNFDTGEVNDEYRSSSSVFCIRDI